MLVSRYKLSFCHTPIKPDLLSFPGIDVCVWVAWPFKRFASDDSTISFILSKTCATCWVWSSDGLQSPTTCVQDLLLLIDFDVMSSTETILDTFDWFFCCLVRIWWIPTCLFFQENDLYSNLFFLSFFIIFIFIMMMMMHCSHDSCDGYGFPSICLFSLLVTCNEALHGTESIFVLLG